jgi:hypothetical protein
VKATKSGVRIAPLRVEHTEQSLAIYQPGIDEGNANLRDHRPDLVGARPAKLSAHRLVALYRGRPPSQLPAGLSSRGSTASAAA